jgi:predicted lysophospholipase L1 biosynthesis ABC-type transport system permease subunit
MTKARALISIVVATMAVMTLLVVGLTVAHADFAIAFSVLLAAVVAAHLCSRVVVHYGRDDIRRSPRR